MDPGQDPQYLESCVHDVEAIIRGKQLKSEKSIKSKMLKSIFFKALYFITLISIYSDQYQEVQINIRSQISLKCQTLRKIIA